MPVAPELCRAGTLHRGGPRRLRPALVAVLALAVLVPACTSTSSRSSPASSSPPPKATSAPSVAPTVPLDPDVAALPPVRAARLAIVVDDVGGSDTNLYDYLQSPVAFSFSIIPFAPKAPDDDRAIHAAGREVLLHIPLANRPGRGGIERGGLAEGSSADAVERYVADALSRVPDAIGANNHEGPYGSSDATLMRALLSSLRARKLFFLDSVTSQRTVGFAIAHELGIPPRINNVFLDHAESDSDSRAAILELARDAAVHGSAIGICHVFHPYVVHVMNAIGAQLSERGYQVMPVSQVTDEPAPRLDTGVRAT